MRYLTLAGGKWFVIVSLLIVQLYAKESQQNNITISKEQNNTLPQEVQETTKTVIGELEKVRVIPGNVILEARIDTGATTTSLGVDSYEIISEDGKEWVEMIVDGVKSKHRVVDYVLIKQHNAESIKRPVIHLRLILGNVSESVEVTLADRSNFTYQLLIGRNFLYDHFIVDVSLKYTATPILYEEK